MLIGGVLTVTHMSGPAILLFKRGAQSQLRYRLFNGIEAVIVLTLVMLK